MYSGTGSAANPTTASYKARAVKFFNAMSSLVNFDTKSVFLNHEKCSKFVGLAPAMHISKILTSIFFQLVLSTLKQIFSNYKSLGKN
jgi:hypothetical protein